MQLSELMTPALLVDEDRLNGNISGMAEHCRRLGVALRPHVKTSKCWEVARRQLAAGAIGFTCSTVAEVAWLRGHGVADLLWAQEPVGRPKVRFVVDTIAESGPFLVALDSVEAARPLAAAATEAGVCVPFLLEVNTGQARAGVDPDRASSVVAELAALAGLALRGVMTHEGHVSKQPTRGDLEEAGRSAGHILVDVAESLRTDGHVVDIVSVGSTPAVTSTPTVPGVTEARPGTYVYYDADQIRHGSASDNQCALTVLARVISTQRDGRAIIDAGSKAMSSDSVAAAGSAGLVRDLAGEALSNIVFTAMNEEHGYLVGDGTADLAVGDLLRIIPNHACTTVNMWSALALHRDGEISSFADISARR